MIRILVFKISIIVLILASSCGGEEPGSSVSVEDQTALLTNIGDKVIMPAYQILKEESELLKSATTTFLAEKNTTNLESLRAALKDARIAWQRCNFLDFGPASTLGLAATINVYPVDKDGIARNMMEGNFDLAGLSAADERGFAAVGFLIHGEDLSDEDVLASFENTENREKYLVAVIDQIYNAVNTVFNQWSMDDGNYLSTFKTNTGTSVGSSLGLLVNALTQSLERKTRDGKIGIPVGLRTLNVPVPNAVEALYAGYSTELAVENLIAYQNLFTGVGTDPDARSSGPGLFSYLDLLDNASLVTDITNEFAAVVANVATLSEPFEEEVVNNPDPANRTIVSLQQLIVLIKSEMTSAMGISITFQDNDGD